MKEQIFFTRLNGADVVFTPTDEIKNGLVRCEYSITEILQGSHRLTKTESYLPKEAVKRIIESSCGLHVHNTKRMSFREFSQRLKGRV